MASIQIYLLGPFQVLLDNRPVAGSVWRNRQTRTILKYLVSRQGSVVPSEQLIELLWPATDVESGRRRLYVRISQLRHVLDPDGQHAYIITEAGGYRFDCGSECWVDAVAFGRKVERGRRAQEEGDLLEAITAYEAARTLYRGDFLEEDLYEDWTSAYRERFREQFLTAVTSLAECYALQGRYRRATGVCRQILHEDPCREAVYVRLMAYHYHAGERTLALREYENCRKALERELGVAPLPSTSALVRQIRAGTLAAATPATGVGRSYPPPAYQGRLFALPYTLGNPPLVGRAQEYAWMIDRWRDPQTRMLALSGTAGIGKTKLAQEFLGYVAGQGAAVLQAAGTSDQALPFAPIVAACNADALRRTWESLPPEMRALLAPLLPERVAQEEIRAQAATEETTDPLLDALSSFLLSAMPTEAVLFVDDAHHLDRSSLRLLARLSHQLTILVAYRTEEVPAGHDLVAALQKLEQQGRLATLRLSPLPPAAVANLVTSLGGRALSALSEQLAQVSGGVPLYLVASLQHLFETGVLYVKGSREWRLTGEEKLSLPPTLRQAIEARLRRIEGDERQLFDLAVVAASADREFDFSLLNHASDLAEDRLLTTIDHLLEAALLVEPRVQGRRELALSHDYYGEVAYSLLPRLRRRRLHRRVAAALLSTECEPHTVAPAIAFHHEEAGDMARALDWWVRAGDEAFSRYAVAEALAFYRRATAAGSHDEPYIWEKIGRLYRRHLGRYEEGALAYEKAAAQRMARGELREAIHDYYALAECHRELSHYRKAVACARKALALAEEIPTNDVLLARAHITLSSAMRSGQLAPVETIRAHLEEARTFARRGQARHYEGEATFWLGVVLGNSGDPVAALSCDREALTAFRSSGRVGWQSIALNNMAEHALQAGETRLALERALEGLEVARAAATVNTERWLLLTLGLVQIQLGMLEKAGDTLQEGLALVEEHGPPRLRAGFANGLAQIALANRRWEAALNLIKRTLPEAKKPAPQYQAWLNVTLARAYLGLEDGDCAHSHAERAQRIAAAKGQQGIEGQAWRVLGEIHATARRGKEAEAAFSRSLRLLQRSGAAVEVARTRVAWGIWKQQQGNLEDAGVLFDAARATFLRAGARLDLERLQDLI